MVTSNWGDEKLFFRHQRMEEDLAIHPEWMPYSPVYDKELFSLEQTLPGSDCPFAWLLQ